MRSCALVQSDFYAHQVVRMINGPDGIVHAGVQLSFSDGPVATPDLGNRRDAPHIIDRVEYSGRGRKGHLCEPKGSAAPAGDE